MAMRTGVPSRGRDRQETAGVGTSWFGDEVDVAEREQRRDGAQTPGVVMVSGDHGDARPGAGEGEQRVVHDLLGFG